MRRGTFRRKTYAEALEARIGKERKQKASITILGRKTPLRARKGLKRAKKPKKVKIKSLKKKLDEVFSKYIRQKYADENEEAICYTCGVKKNIRLLQCGHFISRAYLATRFEEDNVRVQCVGCNVFGGGKTVEFARKITIDIGETIVAELYKKAQQITKDFPYQEKIDYYQSLLENENNL